VYQLSLPGGRENARVIPLLFNREMVHQLSRPINRENKSRTTIVQSSNYASAQQAHRQRERDNCGVQHPITQANPVTEADTIFCTVRTVPLTLQSLPPENSTLTPLRHILSSFTIPCTSCNALHFVEERLTRSSILNPRFSSYYRQQGNVLPRLEEPPEPLYSLLHDETKRTYPSISFLMIQVGNNSKRTPITTIMDYLHLSA
jgi:hypothetical protein